MQVGDEMGPFSVTVTREQLVRYAGASDDYNPIHYDEEAARSFGLPGVIVHGMLNMGLIARFVMESGFPLGARLERYQVRFRSMVQPAQTLAITARVRAIEGSHTTLDVSLGVPDQKPAVQGKMVVALA